ncbi:hypothetical protein [Trichococcus collinsii]|uniref:DUF1129 family protein n=1 Tax=Trichococcus collinsii TaxID=157076 RepID=A0AB37ZYV7_9LACT|nr:hypothetical protein [Trichococcus collinsii]CZR08079.1 Hypothetical protein Tcol_2654 [Trichococcus collinsii]SEA23999.1 hypothetical protein SAMN04488525_102347 [Trichococcus collinsii]
MKENRAKYYREKMNQLEGQLLPENRQYFDDLRSYMIFSSLLYDEGEINEQIYVLANDLLAAQADRITAVEFFGNEPKQMADELISNMPKSTWKERGQLVLIAFGILWGIKLISDFGRTGTVMINPLSYLFDVLLAGIALTLIFLIAQKSVYAGNAWISKKNSQIILMITVFIIFVTGSVSGSFLIPDLWPIVISYPFDLAITLLICVFAGGLILFHKMTEFYPALFVLFTFALNGGIQRYAVAHQQESTPLFMVLPIVIVLAAFVLYLIWNRRIIKNKSNF